MPEVNRAENLKGRVDKVYEFEGYDPLWYMARGHVPAEAFVAEIRREYGVEYGIDSVEHAFARNIPVGRDYPGVTCIHLGKVGRGAYPITYIDIYMRDPIMHDCELCGERVFLVRTTEFKGSVYQACEVCWSEAE